jgi:hypothetical protein
MAGGGVGEAMLIGAAVGAGTGGIMSAVQDKDPLEGALLGAAMGAAGGGIGSGIGGLASGATQAGTQAATTAATTGAGAAAGSGAGGALPMGMTSTIGSSYGAGSALGSSMPSVGSTAGAGLVGGTSAGVPTVASGAAGMTGGATGGVGGGATGGAAGAAPASWGAQGLGQGFAPALTNAQAYGAGAGGGIMGLVSNAQNQGEQWAPEEDPYSGSLSYFKYNPQTFRPSVAPGYAAGGITDLDVGAGQAAMRNAMDPVTMMARGGISSLGSYSDGGRMLRGPGDGMSDDIPGVIAGKQPARLADGEFVVPADVVSHLGNGSTDAGAKKLYSMMDSVRKARTGNKKQGKQIKAEKHIPGMMSGGIASLAEGGEAEEAPVATEKAGTGYVGKSFKGTEYDPNYYNLDYWQQQLPGAQAALEAARTPVEYGQMVGKDFDTLNLDPGTQVKWGAGDQWLYQTVGPDGKIALTPETFGGDPAFGTVKQAYITAPDQAAIDAAQAKLDPIQANISRLESSGIKYDPYTTSGRPSSNEPQFYGNIYKPEYTDYAKPGYDLGAGAGRWSNMTGQGNAPSLDEQVAKYTPKPQFNEEGYLLQKLGQIRAADPYSEFASYTPQQLKAYMASEEHQMTPWQHYEKYGAVEGLNPYLSNELSQYQASLYNASKPRQQFNEEGYLTQKLGQIQANDPNSQFASYTPQQLKAYMGEQGMQPWQHYEQYGRTEGLNPYVSNQTSQALAQVAATQAPQQQAPAQEAPKETEKKRRGGIASLVR